MVLLLFPRLEIEADHLPFEFSNMNLNTIRSRSVLPKKLHGIRKDVDG